MMDLLNATSYSDVEEGAGVGHRQEGAVVRKVRFWLPFQAPEGKLSCTFLVEDGDTGGKNALKHEVGL